MIALTAGGCTFGPRMLERSYGPYYESLRRADEEELLRNLVHARYNETPGSLNVTSIAAQYELNAQAEARPFFLAPNPSNSNVIFRTFTSILPDVSAMGANRPTISLVPGDDSETVRRFLTPITLDNLAFLVQSGWPVSVLLRVWVERLNGVPNPDPDNCEAGPPAPEPGRFQRAVELLQSASDRELLALGVQERAVEVSGPLPAEAAGAAAAVEAVKQGLELRPRADGKSWALVRPERKLVLVVTPGAEQDPELLEVEGLLNLIPGLAHYDLVVATARVPDPLRHPTPPAAELRTTPRSTARVFRYLANGIQVPPEHVAAGLARPAGVAEGCPPTGSLLTVCTAAGRRAPADAYIAVRFRDRWFYIDDRDAASKEMFARMIQLSRLDLRRRPPGGGPLLTLPAGR